MDHNGTTCFHCIDKSCAMYIMMAQKKDKERVICYYGCIDCCRCRCYLIRRTFPRKPPRPRGEGDG